MSPFLLEKFQAQRALIGIEFFLNSTIIYNKLIKLTKKIKVVRCEKRFFSLLKNRYKLIYIRTVFIIDFFFDKIKSTDFLIAFLYSSFQSFQKNFVKRFFFFLLNHRLYLNLLFSYALFFGFYHSFAQTPIQRLLQIQVFLIALTFKFLKTKRIFQDQINFM